MIRHIILSCIGEKASNMVAAKVSWTRALKGYFLWNRDAYQAVIWDPKSLLPLRVLPAVTVPGNAAIACVKPFPIALSEQKPRAGPPSTAQKEPFHLRCLLCSVPPPTEAFIRVCASCEWFSLLSCRAQEHSMGTAWLWILSLQGSVNWGRIAQAPGGLPFLLIGARWACEGKGVTCWKTVQGTERQVGSINSLLLFLSFATCFSFMK